MKLISLLMLWLVSYSALAIVDMKSANYSETTPHLVVPGVGYDLRVSVSYNSRSLYDGLFGYGQCSDFETKIAVTPEGNVKLTECGGGQEILFLSKSFKPDKVDSTIKQILAEVKKRRPELRPDYLATLEKELKTDDFMREEFGRRMNLKGKVDNEVSYLANGREAESITLKGSTFKRAMSDGTFQLFDPATGHMLQMYDKNQNYLKLTWDKDTLSQVADNQGRKLNFKYNAANKKVSEIVGPAGLSAKYTYKGDDLAEVDTKKEKFRYTYDDVHNLTRIDFSDGTYKALTYNKDKDWVTSFRNRKGCLETYDYQVSKDDSKNHFWSDVVKKCGEKTTNQSHYEFWHRMRPDNTGVYLQRVRSDVNGAITDITFHEVFGKPLSILKDGIKVEYTYFDNGFIRTKREPGRKTAFEYKNSCQKVSAVAVDLLEEETPTRKAASAKPAEKVVRQIRTKFAYEPQKCNLITADNSDGQVVRLQYDDRGRIAQIEDQSKKLVKISYEPKFGKPGVVTRPGLGSIKVSYKTDGEIAKVDSKEGPVVARQVASIFNNLLEIISPANSETTL